MDAITPFSFKRNTRYVLALSLGRDERGAPEGEFYPMAEEMRDRFRRFGWRLQTLSDADAAGNRFAVVDATEDRTVAIPCGVAGDGRGFFMIRNATPQVVAGLSFVPWRTVAAASAALAVAWGAWRGRRSLARLV